MSLFKHDTSDPLSYAVSTLNHVDDCDPQVAAIQEALPGVSTTEVRDALSRYHDVNHAMEHLLLRGTVH